MVVVQAAVFVQIEGDDVGKGKAFFLVQADQLRIKGQRSGARGEDVYKRQVSMENGNPENTGCGVIETVGVSSLQS